MVQCVHAFGRRCSKHVRQVFAQELVHVRTRGVVALNVNHALKSSGPANAPRPNRLTPVPVPVPRPKQGKAKAPGFLSTERKPGALLIGGDGGI